MSIREIRHDTASLARFVAALSSYCRTRSGAPSYIQGSTELFKYLEKLADATLSYLEVFPNAPEFETSDYEVHRQKLRAIRNGWSDIHQRLKAASDADTLHVPAPLFDALRDRLHELNKYQNIQIAVFHIERVNFVHYGSNTLRKTANDVADLVGCEQFPPTLSLIGIPYSQSEALFANCIVAHELGHFIYSAEPGLEDTVKNQAMTALKTVFANEANEISPEESDKCADLVEQWWEELFCDLVAIRLLGPAFTHAFIEIRDVVNYIDHRGIFGKHIGKVALEFGPTHPSQMFRIREQGNLLEKLGWWKKIKSGKSHYLTLIDNGMQLQDDEFGVDPNLRHGAKALQAFLSLTGSLHKSVDDALVGLSTGVEEFSEHHKRVADSFLSCTVPSTWGQPPRPSTVVIINTAYDVYLNHLDDLLRRIEKQSASSVLDRAYWSHRLEMWATKAIEDLQV